MKGSTVIVGAVGLIAGLIIGSFILNPGEDNSAGKEVAMTATEPTAEPIRWKMASSFPGELVQLGTQGKMIEERLRVLSGGTMELRFFEPNALVPPLEIFDAVSTGAKVNWLSVTITATTRTIDSGCSFFVLYLSQQTEHQVEPPLQLRLPIISYQV